MKRWLLQLFIYIPLISCTQPAKYKSPVVEPANIVKDMMSWLYYERDYMVWSADYVALDSEKIQITKDEFLDRLSTGKYFPLRLDTKDSSLCYQLYKLDESADKEIGVIIRNKAQIEHLYYKMEGQPLTEFNFVDLDGNVYNKNTVKGKIVVLKCWFIRCIPCVAEMPRLNQLVSLYENRNDVLFVSLAFDPAIDLRKFLAKTTFNYKTVPDKKNYLMNVLNISQYPTHLLINREGLIMKVTNNLEEMIQALQKEILK
jgi:thiol-disulfide isomerase/thioredoxin